jgi:hypothetical protein
MTTSFVELYERARSLEAEPADIDALLVAMDRPVIPGESVRSRADVLQRIIDNPVVGGLRGADRRRVDETAVHALLALGEPYARELSAEGQQLLERAAGAARHAPAEKKPEGRDEPGGHSGPAGDLLLGVMSVLCGLVEVLLTCLLLGTGLASASGALILLAVLLGGGFSLVRPGAQLYAHARVSAPGLVIGLNVLALPVLGVMALLALFFLRSPVMAERTALFLLVAAMEGVLRIVLMIRLLLREQPG